MWVSVYWLQEQCHMLKQSNKCDFTWNLQLCHTFGHKTRNTFQRNTAGSSLIWRHFGKGVSPRISSRRTKTCCNFTDFSDATALSDEGAHSQYFPEGGDLSVHHLLLLHRVSIQLLQVSFSKQRAETHHLLVPVKRAFTRYWELFNTAILPKRVRLCGHYST